MTVDTANAPRVGRAAIALAWAVLLLVSLLPRVILHELLGLEVPSAALSIASAVLLALALVLATAWRPLRPILSFFILLLVLVAAEWLVFTVVDQLPAYREWLTDPSFAVYMPAEQSLRLMVTAIMVGALLVLRGRPSRFFLTPGELAAPMRRIRWLGVNEGTRWSRFAPLAALAISGGTLLFLLIAGAPPLDLVVQAAPFLPIVLLCAALNAFNEEVTYKASFLSVLEGPLGRGHALFMVAAYFGISHYYGVPYGLVGVAMAFALGWLLGRSMLETRGLFWAWFIHFWQDVLIFSFLAIGSIRPGG